MYPWFQYLYDISDKHDYHIFSDTFMNFEFPQPDPHLSKSSSAQGSGLKTHRGQKVNEISKSCFAHLFKISGSNFISCTDCFDLCSELPGDVRLVGGASRCAGKIEMKLQGEWKSPYRPKTKIEHLRVHQIEVDRFGNRVDTVDDQYIDWDMTSLIQVCRQLNCGSLVSLRTVRGFPDGCIHDYLPLMSSNSELPSSKVEITCSGQCQ